MTQDLVDRETGDLSPPKLTIRDEHQSISRRGTRREASVDPRFPRHPRRAQDRLHHLKR